mgnify:CR=1 FL=1
MVTVATVIPLLVGVIIGREFIKKLRQIIFDQLLTELKISSVFKNPILSQKIVK